MAHAERSDCLSLIEARDHNHWSIDVGLANRLVEKYGDGNEILSVIEQVLKRKAKPIQTGFAIGSPSAPHFVYASDQIRASWVIAASMILFIYFIIIAHMRSRFGHKVGRSQSQFPA
jgi:hypothetical protein